ncbi:MAG: mobilization protein [Massilibacteroides sp.]|nr:mobilization protein [Massilibacteroides sp.]
MKNNLLEYIILYVIVACVVLIIATLARLSATAMGFDSFTAFMVFIVVIAIQVVIYLSIHVFLQGLMLPWIGKGLYKIPYFKNKMKVKPTPTSVRKDETTVEPSLEDIRKEQQQNKIREQEEKLNIALDYTRKTFALYVSDEEIEILCGNIKIYVDQLGTDNLQSIKTKDLSIIDIRHFGWNIWNFFKLRNQMDIAHFLKIVFPDILKDVEVESVKSHLKDDELKGIIKIQERLSALQKLE